MHPIEITSLGAVVVLEEPGVPTRHFRLTRRAQHTPSTASLNMALCRLLDEGRHRIKFNVFHILDTRHVCCGYASEAGIRQAS